MPVIKSAIKKLRKDRKREKENNVRREALDFAIRQAKRSSSKIDEAYSVIDRAVKRNIINKNKAARIKSSLSKLASTQGRKPKTTKSSPSTPIKSAAKKKATAPKPTKKARSTKK